MQRTLSAAQCLKLKPQSDLAFSSGKYLSNRRERTVYYVLLRLNSSWVLPVEYIEKLRPELHVQIFIHLRIFQNDPVEIGEAIEPDSVAAQTSDVSKKRLNERKSARVRVPLRRRCVDASLGWLRYARRRRIQWFKHEFADITHNYRPDNVRCISGH